MNYIIVDLDDTLLKSDKTVSEYTANGLDMLRKTGFLFVINTARSYMRTEEYISLLKPDYVICNGGTEIYNSAQECIYQKKMTKVVTNEILYEILNDPSVVNFSVQGIEKLYSRDLTYVSKNSFVTYFSFEEELEEESYKILISSPDFLKYQKIAENYGLFFEKYFDGTWFRISPSTKALGNAALFNLLKDNDPKDYVFGDDNGDMDMIRNAYHGVLLVNAKESLKNQVSHITEYDNNNDGVVRYMEQFR